MNKVIKKALLVAAIVPVLALAVSFVTTGSVFAAGIADGANVANTGSTATSLNDVFKNVVNILLYIIGAISVIMLIFGGIRYTTSAGNTANVTAAKNTILYAIVGLVLAFLAYAVVNWILVGLASGNATT